MALYKIIITLFETKIYLGRGVIQQLINRKLLRVVYFDEELDAMVEDFIDVPKELERQRSDQYKKQGRFDFYQ